MKKIASVLVCLCLWGTVSVMAQRGSGHPGRNRAEMLDRRAGRLADEFGLKDEARADFLTLYRAYQQELMAQRMDRERPETKKEADYTDEEARERIQAGFDRRAQQIVVFYNRLEIDKKYYEKFSKTLSEKQLMKIFVPVREAGNPYRGRQAYGGGRPGGQQSRVGGVLPDASEEN